MKTCNHGGDNFKWLSNVTKCEICGGIAVSDGVVDILRNSLNIVDSQNVNQQLKAEMVQKLWSGENDELTCREFRLKYPEFESQFESLSAI